MPFRADARESRILAVTALLLGLAATLGYLEAVLIPPLPVPGLKLGLANTAVVVALATVGPSRALAVSLGRVLLVGLATGSIAGPTIAMSVSGAVGAWIAMALLANASSDFSVVGWSIGGSAANAVSQLAAATIVTGSAAPLMLLPLSLGLSLPTGIAVGMLGGLLISRVPRLTLSTASG